MLTETKFNYYTFKLLAYLVLAVSVLASLLFYKTEMGFNFGSDQPKDLKFIKNLKDDKHYTLEKRIREINRVNKPSLDNLLTNTLFFSHYKINLNSKCKFWNANLLCTRKDCSVTKLDSNKTNLIWKHYEDLSKIDLNTKNLNKNKFPCKFKDSDFCYLEDESSQDSIVVSLLGNNKERYTGYGGESSNKIWNSIYQENCFNYLRLYTDKNKAIDYKNYDDKDKNIDSISINNKLPHFTNECSEKTIFYKLISGMHTSISTHLCAEYYNSQTNKWIMNPDCFKDKVGNYLDRIDNLYFNYVLLTKAIFKAMPYLRKYKFCEDKNENKKIRSLLRNMNNNLKAFKNQNKYNDIKLLVDENNLFKNKPRYIKEQFKHHFRNISLIMDCVECEKCKLWGKIQVTGYGTALKILFSHNKNTLLNYKIYPDLFQRTEIISLLNTFGRVSHSIYMIEEFDKILKPRKDNYIFQNIKTYVSEKINSYLAYF